MNTNENKQYNKNRNMKRTIKLGEAELKQMIAESVKRVLRESNISDLDVNSKGSYELTYGKLGKEPNAIERKIQILDDFGYALSSAIQLKLANTAGMFKESNPDVYRRIMQIRSDLISAGGCSVKSSALGLRPYDNSESDADYYREMRQAEREF